MAGQRALGFSSWLRKDRPRAGYTPPITMVDGIDTVEGIDVTVLGHGYFAEATGILYDTKDLILHNAPPERRLRLNKHKTSAGVPYWVCPVKSGPSRPYTADKASGLIHSGWDGDPIELEPVIVEYSACL